MALSPAGLEIIPGWFSLLDQDVFGAILSHQNYGHLLEIGVYQGKSAIFVEQFRQVDEEFHVCDVFDSVETYSHNNTEIKKSYEDLSFLKFKINFERFFSHMPIVHICDSENLATRIGSKIFRFIHIDGSHLYDIVKKDLKFASEHLHPEYGVISMDDYRAAHTTGVAAAMWEYIIQGSLVPLLITPNKAYLAKPNHNVDIQKLINSIVAKGYEVEQVDAASVLFYRIVGQEDTFTNQRYKTLRLLLPPIFVNLLQKGRRKALDKK
jgi:hypothetical protein